MKIVILDANTLGDDLDLSIFNKLGELTVYGYTAKEEVVERIKDAHVIITNKVILNEENLKEAPNVKLICLTATGTNNIDKEYARVRGIDVANVRGYSTESVAQHTFALLFYLYEKLAYYDEYVKSSAYVGDRMFTHFDRKFHDLYGKKWGVIGMGAIGQRVAQIAQVFGCEIIYYSTSGKNQQEGYTRVTFDELLTNADIISIHAPLDNNTDNLITYEALLKMKPTATLLNLGRGRIVNESDLAKALNNNIIASAGLDVLEYEPINQGNPLLEIQDSTKLLITPHIAWASVEARKRVVEEVYLNITAHLQAQPRNIVN